MSRNPNDAPSSEEIRRDGAIPYASQIPNDSGVGGDSVADVLTNAGAKLRKVVEDVAIDTLNDEQSAPLGGSPSDEFCPLAAIVHMKDVGGGAAAAGDFQITIGITSGGTEILAATPGTGVINLNDKLAISLMGVALDSIPADSDIFVKVTTKDTTAGAGHLADVYLVGEVFPKA